MSDPGQAVATITTSRSIADSVAAEYDMSKEQLLSAVKYTVFPPADRKGNAPSDANLIAYLSVCHHNGLDPFAGMVWPFPLRDGGFKPVTSIDGFIFIKNNHPLYEGDEYKEIIDEKGNLIAGEMTIYRKGLKPTVHKEWLSEVKRDTEPWKMVHRMLENRATCQTVRRAFGVGLPDSEDVQRAEEINITGESEVMERKTQTKTEALKEKIGAKKNANAAPPTAPTTPLVTPETTPSVAPTASPAAPEPPQTAPVPPSDFPPAEPVDGPIENLFPEEPDPNRLLTEIERQGILSQLKTKAKPEQSADLQKQARQFFMTLGCANTKELKFSDLPKVQEWIDNLKFGN